LEPSAGSQKEQPPRQPYAELHARSNFSFLDGASHPEELVEQAAALGHAALALTDRDGLYGIVRANEAARKCGLKLIVGADITVEGGRLLTLLAQNREGYANLCRLISHARLSHPKGQAESHLDDIAAHAKGLIGLSQDPLMAPTWRDIFGDAFFLELCNHLAPGDAQRVDETIRVAARLHIPTVVTNNVRYHVPARRRLQDVLVCTRAHTTLDKAGRLLLPNAERHLKSPEEMYALFGGHVEALRRTVEIAERCTFRLEEIRCPIPVVPVPEGKTAQQFLEELAREGALARYGSLDAKVEARLGHELVLIEKLGLAGFFLLVWDIVRFCRERGILCQGRGSAASSVVCYALGITAVDPIRLGLVFEKFLSLERAEPADIDLDIEHARREEVLQYVYATYGRDHAAMACEVITYRGRQAVRDVGKALGLSPRQIDRAARSVDEWQEDLPEDPLFWKHAVGLDPADGRVSLFLELSREIRGFPRHLGIHVGGMVVTRDPVTSIVPVENAAMEGRTVIQWDKDDLASMGIVKVDLLGLGILTLLSKAIVLVKTHEGKEIDLGRLPMDDPDVYDLICRGDTIGVFQVESRAQMSMLPRLRPRCFYDLVIEVAIIRPGPIQGRMVHPYLRRRNREEPVEYPHESLRPVLERTLGVPLFQEQGMQIAVVAAGFTPGEADELRRAMGHKRSHARMQALRNRLLQGMEARGISRDVAERIYNELAAFADYGFPESHAASFALLVYASAYFKRYHPAAFYCALLNAQPMGFYSVNTILQDAKRHGIKVLPLNVRKSAWECTLERSSDGTLALRLGIGLVRGLGPAHKEAYEQGMAGDPPRSLAEFATRTRLPRPVLERLAAVGALRPFVAGRREAVWQVQALPTQEAYGQAAYLEALSSRAHGSDVIFRSEEQDSDPESAREQQGSFPAMTAAERMAADFSILGFSVESHPVALLRPRLKKQNVLRCTEVQQLPPGTKVKVAGLAIVIQQPPTAKGMVFVTLEDETGLLNTVVPPAVYAKARSYRDELFVVCEGTVEREGNAVSLLVSRIQPLASRRETTP